MRNIGITCRLDESLDQITDWFQTAIPQLDKMQRLAGESGPTDEEWSELSSLPQRSKEIWQADVQRLPVWVDTSGGPTRPWISLVVDVHSEAILSTAIESHASPDEILVKALWQAFNSPAVGNSHRPGAIHAASDHQREILAEHLEPLGIGCATSSNMARIRGLFREFATQLGGSLERGALIHSPGVTPIQLGGFFEAAAHFYSARPWRQIPGDRVIRLGSERFDSGPWYAVVMGQSGIEQGLALYEDLQLLREMLEGELSEEDSRRRTSAISVTYGEPFDVATEDLDAAEKYGWPVAGPDAYPCVLRVKPGIALCTPLKWELELLEGCLRAIPVFLRQRQGRGEFPVTVSGTTATIQLERLWGPTPS